MKLHEMLTEYDKLPLSKRLVYVRPYFEVQGLSHLTEMYAAGLPEAIIGVHLTGLAIALFMVQKYGLPDDLDEVLLQLPGTDDPLLEFGVPYYIKEVPEDGSST